MPVFTPWRGLFRAYYCYKVLLEPVWNYEQQNDLRFLLLYVQVGSMQEQKIHIGKIVHQELKTQRRSVSWLAEQLHTDRSNTYKILKRQYIDTELLFRLCSVLNVDFFAIISNFINKN